MPYICHKFVINKKKGCQRIVQRLRKLDNVERDAYELGIVDW